MAQFDTELCLRGTRAAQPAAASTKLGALYYVTDEEKLERNSGSAWQAMAFAAPVDLTSEVTGDLPLANLAQSGAASRLLGRGSAAGAGDYQDISLSSALVMDGTTLKKKAVLAVTFDGNGSVLSTGAKGYVRIPLAGTITKVTLLSADGAATAGSIVVDIWKDSYANYPPTVSDTITASAKPTLSAANKSEDSTLTGWTTSITAGDILGFNIDSVATVTRVLLELELTLGG
jgi:hypothetical protein